MNNLKIALVEFIGTFIFLSVILNSGKHGLLAIAVALLAVIYFGSHVSGGHFNPAVSVMSYFSKDPLSIKSLDVLAVYIVAQVLGGLAALQFQDFIKLQ